MPSVYRQARTHIRLTRRLNLTLWRKAFILSAIMASTLYVILFSTTPAVHDYFHELRHSLMFVPCH
jgi:cobalt transporter subunit CbtB